MREEQGLAKLGPASDFVLNAMAMIFVVTLDDIPQGERNAYACSMSLQRMFGETASADPENPLEPDGEAESLQDLPWGHVVTRDVEAAGPLRSTRTA